MCSQELRFGRKRKFVLHDDKTQLYTQREETPRRARTARVKETWPLAAIVTLAGTDEIYSAGCLNNTRKEKMYLRRNSRSEM